jgi:hypothetical protein
VPALPPGIPSAKEELSVERSPDGAVPIQPADSWESVEMAVQTILPDEPVAPAPQAPVVPASALPAQKVEAPSLLSDEAAAGPLVGEAKALSEALAHRKASVVASPLAVVVPNKPSVAAKPAALVKPEANKPSVPAKPAVPVRPEANGPSVAAKPAAAAKPADPRPADAKPVATASVDAKSGEARSGVANAIGAKPTGGKSGESGGKPVPGDSTRGSQARPLGDEASMNVAARADEFSSLELDFFKRADELNPESSADAEPPVN